MYLSYPIDEIPVVYIVAASLTSRHANQSSIQSRYINFPFLLFFGAFLHMDTVFELGGHEGSEIGISLPHNFTKESLLQLPGW